MPIWGGKPQEEATGCPLNDPVTTFRIPQSLRFRANAQTRIVRQRAVAGDRTRWTFSTWFKRSSNSSTVRLISASSAYAATFDSEYTSLLIAGGGPMKLAAFSHEAWIATNKLFLDTVSWYHVVLSWDSNNSNPTDRAAIYINGNRLQQSDYSYFSIPQGQITSLNAACEHAVGSQSENTQYGVGDAPFEGYIAETHFIDGQPLTANDFGYFDAATGIWMPKAYPGAYGQNGFYFDYSDPSDFGRDKSGAGNNFVAKNFNVSNSAPFTDQVTDSPTWYGLQTGAGGDYRGNFATLNIVGGVSEGGLRTSGAAAPCFTPPNNSGTYYFERDGAAVEWTPPAAFPGGAGAYNFGQRPFVNRMPSGRKYLTSYALICTDPLRNRRGVLT